MFWSLSSAHHSTNWQRQQGQSRSEQELRTVMNLIPCTVHACPTGYVSVTCRTVSCKKKKEGTHSTLSSDSIFSCCQSVIELEQLIIIELCSYCNTIWNDNDKVKRTFIAICIFFLVEETAAIVINKGTFEAKISLTINGDLFIFYFSHQGQIRQMGWYHSWVICRRLA